MNQKSKTPKPGVIFVDRDDAGKVKKLSVNLNLEVVKDHILAAIEAGEKYYSFSAFTNTYKQPGESTSPDYNLRFKTKRGAGNGAKAAAGSNVEYPI